MKLATLFLAVMSQSEHKSFAIMRFYLTEATQKFLTRPNTPRLSQFVHARENLITGIYPDALSTLLLNHVRCVQELALMREFHELFTARKITSQERQELSITFCRTQD